MVQEKILFIDRDGTLIDEPKDNFQVDKIEKLFFEPNVIFFLKKIVNLGFKLVLITNQDGLYTENFSYKSFILPHKFMIDIFLSQGIYFDHILICPHILNDCCECRKPKIELVMPWLKRNLVDKNESYVIGDRETDLELAKNMGIRGILYDKTSSNWEYIYNVLSKKNRNIIIIRNTKETKVKVELCFDAIGVNNINTGISFFNHMLEQIAIHSNILMNINVSGDLEIDDHHTIEDTGIALGHAILKCLGNKIGISRFGFHVPMDESASYCLLDFSGRSYLKFIGKFSNQFIGDFSTDMIEHFFRSLAYSMKSTIHLISIGSNDHHKIESLFKAFGRSLKKAIRISGQSLPTSKGIL